jgi:DNA invertase Pin-like site-specific DNA recombinase
VAESAKRGAARAEFNCMFAWVKKNARKEGIQAILSHKLDRICRNLRDAVRLQELDDVCGVKLVFVENQFGPGAAGQLSFNVMAAVAQYYSDNLQSEVRKGMDEKVRQGWLPAHAPFGYVNVQGNREEPIRPDPEKARIVCRIFELYARGDMTFKRLADRLQEDGYIYRSSQPRFCRTTLSYILNNRFYVGDIEWHGQLYPGKHRPLVSRHLFQACQDVLRGRNRRTGSPKIAYSGGLLRCAYCGAAITGEEIRRQLKDGSIRSHYYYKCRKTTDPDHPRVRWRQDQLEGAIVKELEELILPVEASEWVREALAEAFADTKEQRRRAKQAHKRRRADLKAMHDRLVTAYLQGTLDEAVFVEKANDLKSEMALVDEALQRAAEFDDADAEMALTVFDFSQQVVERWEHSEAATRRQILECVSSNRALSDVSLALTKRRPFDVIAERAFLGSGRGDWIRTSDLLTPSLEARLGSVIARHYSAFIILALTANPV